MFSHRAFCDFSRYCWKAWNPKPDIQQDYSTPTMQRFDLGVGVSIKTPKLYNPTSEIKHRQKQLRVVRIAEILPNSLHAKSRSLGHFDSWTNDPRP